MSQIVRGLGYASVAMMASTTIVGMAHSGITDIPKEGTWLLSKGERVLDPRTNADLKGFLSSNRGSPTGAANDPDTSVGAGGITINQHFAISGNGDKALTAAMAQAADDGARKGAALARQEILQDFQTRGQARRLLNV
jgi:hypothetical protein